MVSPSIHKSFLSYGQPWIKIGLIFNTGIRKGKSMPQSSSYLLHGYMHLFHHKFVNLGNLHHG